MRKVLSVVMVLCVALGLTIPFATPVAAQQFHGTSIQKNVIGPDGVNPIAHVGDTVTASIKVTNNDDFGDSITVVTITDTVHHTSGDEITLNLLPGSTPVVLPAKGNSVEVSHTYTVQAGDPSILTDDAQATGTDSGLELPFLVTYPGQLLVINPQLSILKTVDCNGDGVFNSAESVIGSSDNPTWKVLVTNTGDSTVSNIVVTDTNLHSFGAPFSLAAGAHQEFTYTTTITGTTTNTATATGKDLLNATVGPVSSSATNNLTERPETTLQSITATPSILPIGGGDVLITVIDKNTGDVPLTGCYFVLTSSTGGGPVHMSPDGVAMAPGATQTFTYTFTNVTVGTTFTAVGHGFAGTLDVTGPLETGHVSVTLPPPTPASSDLSIGLLIAGFAGALTFFGWQRRKRSQPSS